MVGLGAKVTLVTAFASGALGLLGALVCLAAEGSSGPLGRALGLFEGLLLLVEPAGLLDDDLDEIVAPEFAERGA